MLPKLIEGEESFVINIHDYLDGRGIHRVCIDNQILMMQSTSIASVFKREML